MPDVSALHAANAGTLNNAQAAGPALPPREQAPVAVPTDADVMHTLTQIDTAQKQKNQPALEQYSQQLIGQLIMQENPAGQQKMANVILNGGIKTPADIAAFNKMLAANAAPNHTVGPITIQVDDMLATAASDAPKVPHESPPTSAMISSASSQGPQGPQPQMMMTPQPQVPLPAPQQS